MEEIKNIIIIFLTQISIKYLTQIMCIKSKSGNMHPCHFFSAGSIHNDCGCRRRKRSDFLSTTLDRFLWMGMWDEYVNTPDNLLGSIYMYLLPGYLVLRVVDLYLDM